MSVEELADLMFTVGSTHAPNLDGGYSSIFVEFGELRNQYLLQITKVL